MRDAVAEFRDFNREFARRNPELLRLKVERMAASAFAFYRGTFHLFAHDVLGKVIDLGLDTSAPEAELDLVGDLHSENFGTYQAEDGEVHYDINDFDETTQGRFDFDVRRLATSLVLASQARKDSLVDGVQAALMFLNTYAETVRKLLKKGKNIDLDVVAERPSGSIAVDRLLRSAARAKRTTFIANCTETQKDGRRLVRNLRYFNLSENERNQALRLLEDYRKRQPDPPNKSYYEVEDVCGRVSGIGSMGRLRYAVLIAAKGSKDARNVILEFKESRPSAYDTYRKRQTDDAALVQRAARVIEVQKQSQTHSSPRLGCAVDGNVSFQVREIGPRDARLDADSAKNPAEFREVAAVQATLLAKTHARAAARAVGVANPLAEQSEVDAFCARTLAFALAYADLTRRDWQRFVSQRSDLDRPEAWAAGK